jgi:hypothetical protein
MKLFGHISPTPGNVQPSLFAIDCNKSWGKIYGRILTFLAKDNVERRLVSSLEFTVGPGSIDDSASEVTLLLVSPVMSKVLVTKHERNIAICMHIDFVLTDLAILHSSNYHQW